MVDIARRLAALVIVAALAAPLVAGAARADDTFITLASTTSVRNSGLYDWLLPKIKGTLGIDIRVIAVGTGQAIRLAMRGDADALLVHDEPAERAFMAAGFGRDRRKVMYNHFVIIGPDSDPARAADVGAGGDAPAALRAIAAARKTFVSRGDESGTHKMELRLWQAAGLDPAAGTGQWYREVGAGMGATLNMAVAMGGYALSDRASWISFANRAGLKIVVPQAPALFNQYSIMAVNPERHTHVKTGPVKSLIDWLTGRQGQAVIATYRVAGEQVFFPNADRLLQ